MDSDHFKKAYQGTWDASTKREMAVKEAIEAATYKTLAGSGFGAESTEFIHGSAADHGYELGGADYVAEGTNIRIEVTGTDSPRMKPEFALWVRPDKIESAADHIGEETWVVHQLDVSGLRRAILIDAEFLERYERGEFEVREVHPHGVTERYVVIPARDRSVHSFDAFLDRLKKA